MPDDMSYLYNSNIAISWGLLVLIWLVQIIIYPGLSRLPSEDFVNYHRWYMIRISAIVLPLMICEVIITNQLAHDGKLFGLFL